MAKFTITPTTTVAELKEQYSNEVGGGVLRVYDGRSEAADDATLVSLGAKEGELECRTSRTVGKFEEAFQDELNLKVKVYTPDNWVKVLDGITLAAAAELPKGMTKEKMEEYLSYQRDEKEETKENTENSPMEDIKSLYEKSVALAEQTDRVALPLHKYGDKYFGPDEDSVGDDDVVFATNGKDFVAFGVGDDAESVTKWLNEHPDYTDVYYTYGDCNECIAAEVMDQYQNDSIWPWEWDNMTRAIVDSINNDASFSYPPFRVDLIYNGEIIHSFDLG